MQGNACWEKPDAPDFIRHMKNVLNRSERKYRRMSAIFAMSSNHRKKHSFHRPATVSRKKTIPCSQRMRLSGMTNAVRIDIHDNVPDRIRYFTSQKTGSYTPHPDRFRDTGAIQYFSVGRIAYGYAALYGRRVTANQPERG